MQNNYYAADGGLLRGMGQAVPSAAPTPSTSTAVVHAEMGAVPSVLYLASLAASGALAYHGYKRNNSVGWALVWGLAGGIVWPVSLAIAFSQGFAKSRLRKNRLRRNRRRLRRTAA